MSKSVHEGGRRKRDEYGGSPRPAWAEDNFDYQVCSDRSKDDDRHAERDGGLHGSGVVPSERLKIGLQAGQAWQRDRAYWTPELRQGERKQGVSFGIES